MSTTKFVFNPFTSNFDEIVNTIDLTADVTGILPIANGGTGMSTALPPGVTLYVDGNRVDSYTPDGTIGKPFLTITAALAQIISNNNGLSYTISVAPGTYTENITLNNAAFSRLAIVANSIVDGQMSLDAISVTTINGDIISTANNDTLKSLIINGFSIAGNVNLVGANTGTTFLQFGGMISNCVMYTNAATGILVQNAGEFIFQNFGAAITSGAGAVSVQNVTTFRMYSSSFLLGAISIVTNGAVNKPSGFSSSTFHMAFSQIGGSLTIGTGSFFISRICRINASISSSGGITSVKSAFLGTVTANSGSTWSSHGDSFTNLPIVSAITFLPVGSLADKAHFLGTYNPISGVNLAIGASSASTIGEIIKLAATPTADALQVQDSTATVLSKIDATGKIFVPNANVSSLGASSPVLTDASKNLVSGNINLASQVTGVLPEVNGGTAQSTYATGDTLYASAPNVLSKRAIGSTGDVLTVAGGVPTWAPNAGSVYTYVSATDTNNTVTSAGTTANTYFQFVSGLNITLTAGTWIIRLKGMITFETPGANFTQSYVRFGTSSTPGSGLIDVDMATLGWGYAVGQTIEAGCYLESEPYVVSSSDTIYVNQKWNSQSGVVTSSQLGFRGDLATTVLSAIRVA